MENDPTFKAIFSSEFMVRELLDWFVGGLPGGPELLADLDLDSLRRTHEQSVAVRGARLRRFARDLVCTVRFRRRRHADGNAWLHLVLLTEFQREPDWSMPLRMRNYVDGHYMELVRGAAEPDDGPQGTRSDQAVARRRRGRLRVADRLPPVLPIVIYTGKDPWRAPQRVIDLVTPPPPDAAQNVPDLTSDRSGLFAGDGYLVLDIPRLAADAFRDDNAVSLLAQLTSSFSEGLGKEGQASLVAKLYRRLRGPALRDLRNVVLGWIRQESGLDLEADEMETLAQEEAGEMESYIQAQTRIWRERYREEGREQGREEGHQEATRAALRMQAETKFGADTAARIADLVAEIDNQARLTEMLRWIIACETGEELLARASGSGNGR